jgi:transcriptional regulator with XRE-family HTH domain
MFHDMNTTPTRDTWRAMVRERGLTLKGVAKLTGKSFRSVSAYSEGTRRPSDEWIAKVGAVLAALDEVAA